MQTPKDFDIKKYGNQLYQHFLKQRSHFYGSTKNHHGRASNYTVNNINTLACLMSAEDAMTDSHLIGYETGIDIRTALPCEIRHSHKVTKLILAKIKQMKRLGLVSYSQHTRLVLLTSLGIQVLDDYYKSMGVTYVNKHKCKKYLFAMIRERFDFTRESQPVFNHSSNLYLMERMCHYYEGSFKQYRDSRSKEINDVMLGSMITIAACLFNTLLFEPVPYPTLVKDNAR